MQVPSFHILHSSIVILTAFELSDSRLLLELVRSGDEDAKRVFLATIALELSGQEGRAGCSLGAMEASARPVLQAQDERLPVLAQQLLRGSVRDEPPGDCLADLGSPFFGGQL
jgi:hypothetical protein